MNTGPNDLLAGDHAQIDILLTDALDKLRSADRVEAIAALDLFWARLAMHIRAEHLHLFPAALKIFENEALASGAEVLAILERLRRDHDYFMHELADSIKAMRSIVPANEREIMQQTAGRLRAIESRLVEHNAVEEERIYPLQRFLPVNDGGRLSRSITKELTNLPPRFLSEG